LKFEKNYIALVLNGKVSVKGAKQLQDTTCP